jgi:very-short-patch-repair endonuclease
MKTLFFKISMFFGANSTTLRTAAMLRTNMTPAEILLWKELKDRMLFNAKFHKQHSIGIFIVDFYCHEYKLVIEVDGEVHNNEETNDYDTNRTAELNRFSLRVIRFTNDEVTYNINYVSTMIQRAICKLTPL